MAIEIKELIVKFSVVDNTENRQISKTGNVISKEQMRSIVEQCKAEVLEKMLKLTER